MKSWPLVAAAAAIARAQFCEHQWQGQFAKREDQPPHLEIQKRQTTTPPPPLEIKPLIVSGPSENRVDLIFFGDGYTEAEKDKFFDDAMALATELTDGRTFADVLPVMNWWAGFTASNEVGFDLVDDAVFAMAQVLGWGGQWLIMRDRVGSVLVAYLKSKFASLCPWPGDELVRRAPR